MKVYTYFDSASDPAQNDPDFLRLWARSWQRQGFEPKILTATNARRSKVYDQDCDADGMFDLALTTTPGGAWYSSPRIINFGFGPKRPKVRWFFASLGLYWIARGRIDDWWKAKPTISPAQCVKKFKAPGWDVVPLVDFSGYSGTEVVTTCGRPLF